MNLKRTANIHLSLAWLLVAIACSMTLWTAWLSRYQPIEWDLAMLHYAAFLINEKGFILYKDIFENNLPGVFLFHSLLGYTLGYDALPLRIFDFAVLGSIGLLSWYILAPLTKPGAVLGACVFIAIYLYSGSYNALQRDYLGIVPTAFAFCVMQSQFMHPRKKEIGIGALCGLACWFKPNCIIVLPILFFLHWKQHPIEDLSSLVIRCLRMGTAFLILFSIPLVWAFFKGDYAALLDIYKKFTPIYLESRSDLYHYASSQEKWLDLTRKQFEHTKNILIISAPGVLWAWRQLPRNSTSRTRLFNLVIFTLSFSFYELMAGKFWMAHLLPSYYWAMLLCSLVLIPAAPSHTGKIENFSAFLCTILAAGAAFFVIHSAMARTTDAGYTEGNAHIRSHKIASFLKLHMKNNDTVQGIDGSGDGQGALLLARATSATRFLEDIPLYMQPEAPATQSFRKEFLHAISTQPPTYIVYIHNIFHPAGGNRLKEFQALNQFIESNYRIAEEIDGEYTIFQHQP